MSFEQVVELGKLAESVSFLETWHAFSILQIVGFVAAFTIGGFLLFYGIKEGEEGPMMLGTCILILPTTFIFFTTNEIAQEKEIAKWKEQVAMPYILSLPEEKHELVYAKLDPEVIVEGYRYVRSTKTTAMTLSFLDESGTIETETDWVEANMTLSKDDTAYVTYHRLPESLGHGIDVGNYYKVVHLPKGYRFTEMK